MAALVLALASCAAGSTAGAQTGASAAPSAQVEAENGAGQGVSKATVIYNGDALWNVAGGAFPGAMYEGRLGFIFDYDLEQALGWRGATAHLSVHALHGSGISGDLVQNLMTVSSLEAVATIRLFNLWIEQQIGHGTTLRIGQFTAGQEFMISLTANLFVNSTFGWPASFAADLPSGGPSFPLATPGVRISMSPDPSLTLLAAVFAGDPAGKGGGDPQTRDMYGFNSFKVAGGTFFITELQQMIGSGSSALTLKLGAWRHSASFPDLQPAHPTPHHGNSTAYAIVDAPLSLPGPRSLHAFVRVSVMPSDRNRINQYADAGLNLSAPFSSRPDDTFGLAIATAHLQADPAQGAPKGGRETTFEATYQLQLNQQSYLQADLQYVRDPNGGAPTAATGRPAANALLLGMRVSMKF